MRKLFTTDEPEDSLSKEHKESFFEHYAQQCYEIANYNADTAEHWLKHCKWFAVYSAVSTFIALCFAVIALAKKVN